MPESGGEWEERWKVEREADFLLDDTWNPSGRGLLRMETNMRNGRGGEKVSRQHWHAAAG